MGEIQWSTNINYVPALICQPTVYSLGTAKNRGPAKFLGNRPGTVSGTVTGTGSPLMHRRKGVDIRCEHTGIL